MFERQKWLWCLLALYPGSWKPVGSITVKTPPNTPATVEAQAKFFQDFFSVQLSPYKMEFGHVCEDPDTWEQRYEKKDFKNHRDMGKGSERHFTERHERSRPSEGLYSAKVRWGDKQGGYGEHYWDLNHAGHADKHGDDGDDGSYSVHDHEDPYDEPSEQQSTYDDDYDPEQAAKYEETNRAKRHHKVKAEKKDTVEDVKTLRRKATDENKRKTQVSDEQKEEYQTYKPGKLREANIKRQNPAVHDEEYQNFKSEKLRYKPKEVNYEEEDQPNPNSPVIPEQPDSTARGGAGVRQHQPAEVTAASAPRLFLEPSTGHVVDRATGQAYVLQPIPANYQ
ncbi:hypothetical protein NE865_02768 [Phthorimaea operculella]|nr:hypothetical protein NE865_02768 [Phthorimaea operculella]